MIPLILKKEDPLERLRELCSEPYPYRYTFCYDTHENGLMCSLKIRILPDYILSNVARFIQYDTIGYKNDSTESQDTILDNAQRIMAAILLDNIGLAAVDDKESDDESDKETENEEAQRPNIFATLVENIGTTPEFAEILDTKSISDLQSMLSEGRMPESLTERIQNMLKVISPKEENRINEFIPTLKVNVRRRI